MPEIHQTHLPLNFILCLPASILSMFSHLRVVRGSTIHNPKCQGIVKQTCMNENTVWCHQREEEMINYTEI